MSSRLTQLVDLIARAPKLVLVVVASLLALLAAMPAAASGPTCSDVFDIANHGQHIVGDYVTETGHDGLDWPPAGSVGQTIAGNGAAQPGAPGIHQHGGGTAQPGASFCNPQANSPTGEDLPRGK
jgi:hypothetical protein